MWGGGGGYVGSDGLSHHDPTHVTQHDPNPTQAERERLRDEGFKDWTRKDLRALVNALEKHGREDKVGGGGVVVVVFLCGG